MATLDRKIEAALHVQFKDMDLKEAQEHFGKFIDGKVVYFSDSLKYDGLMEKALEQNTAVLKSYDGEPLVFGAIIDSLPRIVDGYVRPKDDYHVLRITRTTIFGKQRDFTLHFIMDGD